MKRLYPLMLAACCALAGLAMATNVRYRFSSAGNYPGAFQTDALAVNLTQIVGYYVISNSSPSYLETFDNSAARATFLTIAPPGSGTSYASGINVHGAVAGGYCTPGCTYPQSQHGYTWDQVTYTTIDYPGAMSTGAYGINDLGQVVGGVCSTNSVCAGSVLNPTQHAFLDDHGAFIELDYPGAYETEANAINNAGQIAGVYNNVNGGPNSFLYQNGVYTRINYSKAVWIDATAINNHGVVAGTYQDGLGNVRGFLYRNGKFETIDHPNTGATAISGINDDGVIVGAWSPNGGYANFKGVPVP